MSSISKSIAFSPSWSDTPSASPAANLPAVSPSAEAQKRRKIIVADDDPISREIVVGLVAKWNFEAIPACDGPEAMQALRTQNEPVLAVLDWMMPGLEGPEICRRVREVNRSVYILLLTSRSDKARIVEGLRAGADDYLTKPFDKDELHARLSVGARIIDLQCALNARVAELEGVIAENVALKLQMPI